MNKRRFLVIVMFVLAVGTMVALFVSRSFHRQTLSSYVEELRAKGEKMTFEEMVASLSLLTNNSLEILTNVVQKLGPLPGDATNIDAMHFVGPGRAQVAWRLAEPTWATSAASTSQVNWVDGGDRIALMAAPLAELRRAMKQPAPNAGIRTNFWERPTPFRAVQSAAYWLACDALWNLHQGRRAEALASIQAIAGMANLHREECSLLSQMTRAAVADLGLKLTWEALQAKEWTGEQLLALQQCWETADFLETAEKGMEGERCMGREAMKKAARDDPALAKRLAGSYYETNVLDSDLVFHLRHVQSYVEQVRALRANRAWSEVSASLDELNARVDALARLPLPQRFRYLLSSIAIPNFKRAVWKSVQVETQRRFTITVVALNLYKHKHGEYPSSLSAITPEFLPAVPRDCMNGNPLRYQRKSSDSFILYSVGEDGQDNGGDPSSAKPDGKPGLWEGRDAVWPMPDRQ